MAAVRKLRTCAVSPTGKHSASIIFLHGSGDTGQGLRAWVRDVMVPDLAFSHIRVIYPTAPARPYTPIRGALSTVWFDRYKISRDCPEHLDSIDAMCSTLGSIIQDEVNAGIPKHRMVIVEERLGAGLSLSELFQCHGTSDDLVLPQWGEDTSMLLRKAGMATTFHSFPGLRHQLSQPEMELLRSWILNKLPPTTSS